MHKDTLAPVVPLQWLCCPANFLSQSDNKQKISTCSYKGEEKGDFAFKISQVLPVSLYVVAGATLEVSVHH